ncbi:transglycosylase SLT domain-containing protein [Trueperella bernardiae]|uniref:C40 family peptidase n=1 Tax=Trueperella bernardiae TaxID=59561 RepID=UPI002556E35B|nr:transglycosylase SLT domain-containing protein [Trueperella bernardiae]WIM08012.1 transglycosylase SLT domain-containing protein [Trueperella bernardiae]
MNKHLALLVIVLTALPLGIVLLLTEGDASSAAFAGAPSAVPAQYQQDVARAGSICPEITPAIIAAQIDAESGWNPDAVSPAGAQGIAQFMPSTWATAGRDGNGDGNIDILNPADAIYSQGQLMCDNAAAARALIEAGTATGDVVELALAGYNAGMGAVQTYGGIPPYRETQTYIARILNLAATTYATAAAPTGGRADVIAWAQSQIGKPYRGHANGPGCGSFGPACYDCCGLVQQAFLNAAGIDLPMSVPGNPWATSKCEYAILARASEYGGQVVSSDPASLAPGDILFFQNRATPESVDYITHVAIYIGNNSFIDASPDAGIAIHPLTYYEATERLLPQAVRVGTP